MRKSKRLVIFSEIEKRAFYEVPNFDDTDRDKYLNFSDEEKDLIMKCKFLHLKIFCAIQIGYFKAVKIFNVLGWKDIKEEDIDYITKSYFNGCELNKSNIAENACYIQRKNIVQLYGYRLRVSNLAKLLTDQSLEIIKRDVSVNFTGRELIKFLEKIKVVRPGYTTLQTIISNSLTAERKRISSIIDKELNVVHKKEIKSLLSREEGVSKLAALHQDAKNFGFKMMLKERYKHKTLESFYSVSQSIIKKLGISQQNVVHYADLATHYNSRDLSILAYNQSYLYILCYIFQKYQEINDNLVEAFRYNAKKADAGIRTRVKKKFQEEKADVEKKIGRLLLLYVNKKIGDKIEFQKIRKRAFRIMQRDKIEILGNQFLKTGQHKKEFYWKEVDKVKNTHQKNLRPLFTQLKFTSEKDDNKWLKSINWLKNEFNNKNTKTEDEPASMPKNLKKYFLKNDKSFNTDRYEYWLYNQIEEKVRLGELYIEDSILYNSLNNELLPIEKSKDVIKTMDISWVKNPTVKQVDDLLKRLDSLWLEINDKYENGELKHLKYDAQKKKFVWSKIKANKDEELQNNFYLQLPFCEINEIMSFVNEKTNFLSAFKPLQERYHKEETISDARKRACILSKALNYGDYKMSQASDITHQELKTTSSQILRLSTLREANDIISNATSKLPIYPYYAIDLELLFSSLDGQKYELDTPNIKARNSKKYLREKPGVSAYTIFANNIPFNCYTIGSNEHESYYVFDIWYNNTTNIDPQIITGDMHSLNKANFAILHWFEVQYKPRFTSLNTQLKKLYCGSNIKNYKNYALAPIGEIDAEIIIKNEEKINQIIATLGLKEMNQANLVKKLCNLPIENNLRKAVFEFDKLIRSIYTLEYMIDFQLQKNVHKSQNRIEAYHQLRACIAKIGGKKKLYGKTNVDIEISNQCGRLVANIVIYYNSLILSWGFQSEGTKIFTSKLKKWYNGALKCIQYEFSQNLFFNNSHRLLF